MRTIGPFWDKRFPNAEVLRSVMGQADPRDALILSLLYESGLSAEEVSALQYADVARSHGHIVIRTRQDGGEVALSDAGVLALKACTKNRGKGEGPLLLAPGMSGEQARLSAASIRQIVTRKSKWDAVIVKRDVDAEGRVDCYDKNDRPCWDMNHSERVVLTADLRRYAEGLHIGQLGWTLPETCDGYRSVDVRFDNGPTIEVLTFSLQRVLPECAEAISAQLIAGYRGTEFDADGAVAAQRREEWIRAHYGSFVETEGLVIMGDGPEELYAFTFPSLKELALLKNQSCYPVKVGYTRRGAMARVAGLMDVPRYGPADLPAGLVSGVQLAEAMGENSSVERAGYPEKPGLLLVYRTTNGRVLEQAVHQKLSQMGRHVGEAPGREWYRTNTDELVQICRSLLAT